MVGSVKLAGEYVITGFGGAKVCSTVQKISSTIPKLAPARHTRSVLVPKNNFAEKLGRLETEFSQPVVEAHKIGGRGLGNEIVRGWENFRIQDRIVKLKPTEILFSQSSVSDVSRLVMSMEKRGWVGSHIDVVKLPNGQLVTLDNTRLLAAHKAGIDPKCVIRKFDEPLSKDKQLRFMTKLDGTPNTWGEAVQFRINKQKNSYKKLYPNGSRFISSME